MRGLKLTRCVIVKKSVSVLQSYFWDINESKYTSGAQTGILLVDRACGAL